MSRGPYLHPRFKAVLWSLIGYYLAEALPYIHVNINPRWHWNVIAPVTLTVLAGLLGT